MKNSAVLLILLLLSCYSRPTEINEDAVTSLSRSTIATGYAIDLKDSYVYWKGTKLLYTGMHEGLFKFEDGHLEISDGKISGGQLLVTINSLTITDIPAHETIPIRNITGHLLEDLSAEKYPLAAFNILSVAYTSPSEFTLLGELQIKDVKRRVSVKGKTIDKNMNSTIYDATLTINRFDWKIGDDNSWLEKKLVDAEVELKMHVVVGK